MENMKREYKLLAILLFLLVGGWGLNYLLVASKQSDAQKISAELDEKKAQFLRDQAVNEKVKLTRKVYEGNIKSNENYNAVTIPFLDRLQNLLTASAIKVNPQDIQQVSSSSEVVENNLAFYSFDISFSTEYKNLKQFLKSMEVDEYLFDITSINIVKVKNEPLAPTSEVDGVQAPQPVSSRFVKVSMRVQITKFI